MTLHPRIEAGTWKLPRQRPDRPDDMVVVSDLPGAGAASADRCGMMHAVHWAPRDHRFRPYRWRVTLQSRERCRLGVWVSPENPLPLFLPWLHAQVGRGAGTWTARLVYAAGIRGGMSYHLYFVRCEHALRFVLRWIEDMPDQPR